MILSDKSLEINNHHFLELANEENFKELIKKKIFYYQDVGEDNSLGDLFKDKCLICDETFNKEKEAKKEEVDDEFNLIVSNDEEIIENNVEGIIEELVKCPYCSSMYHMLCLAQSALGNQLILIPKMTDCMVCGRSYNWNDYLIK